MWCWRRNPRSAGITGVRTTPRMWRWGRKPGLWVLSTHGALLTDRPTSPAPVLLSELTIPELHLMLLESFFPGTLWKQNALGLRPMPFLARLQLDDHFPDLGLRCSAYEVAWGWAVCARGTRAVAWHSRQPSSDCRLGVWATRTEERVAAEGCNLPHTQKLRQENLNEYEASLDLQATRVCVILSPRHKTKQTTERSEGRRGPSSPGPPQLAGGGTPGLSFAIEM